MIWYFGVHAIDLIAILVEEEIEEGTLEQVYMSKTKFITVLFFRIIAQIIFDSVKGFFVSIICIIAFKIPLDFLTSIPAVQTIVVFFAVLFGLYGIGYMVAGFSMVYKRATSIAAAFSNILLFFSGITISVEDLPVWSQNIARLFPPHYGISVLQKNILENLSFGEMIKSSDFLSLIIIDVFWTILGVSAFKFCEYKVRKNSSFAQY